MNKNKNHHRKSDLEHIKEFQKKKRSTDKILIGN